MSDQSNAPGTGASVSNNAAASDPVAGAQDGQPNPQDGGEAWIKWNNKKELQDTIARSRVMERTLGNVIPAIERLEAQLAKMVGGGTPPAPAATPAAAPPVDDAGSKALAQVEALTRKLNFEKAANAAGIKEGTPQRELLESAYDAAKPADVGEWLKKYTGALAAPAKAVIPGGSPRLGAPATPDESERLPANPLQLAPEVLANMTPEERVNHYNQWRAKSGQGNPLASKIAEVRARLK